MKTLMLTALSLALLGLNTSHAAIYTLSGGLDVLQAGTNGDFVTGSGNGTGTIVGDYDDVADLLNYTITWQDLLDPGTVTNMHFHNAPAGASAGVDLGIPANSGADWVSPIDRTAIPVGAAEETNLLAGNWYVNIHTSNFGGGEIRGQVLVALVPEPATAGLAVIAFLSAVSLGRRKR